MGQAGIALDSVEDMLESLFEISRLDAGAIQPEVRAISLDRILSALKVEFAPLARSRGLAFAVPETGLFVSSDVQMLRRVLQNLVSNAIRYTAEGSVTVTAQAAGGRVTVAVTDTGPGIAAHEQRVVFEEFRRLDATRKIPGHGLGLAIVRRSCAKLGHGVTLESVPGRGSTFAITLPIAEAHEAATTPPGPRRSKPAQGGGAILVIDNDETILAGMRALLENWGHAAITAVGPDHPDVRAAAAAGLSLILADYHLADDLTGDQAVARVRALHGGDLPAAIITADRSEDVRGQLAAAGLPVLTKPVKPAQLRALLRRIAAAS